MAYQSPDTRPSRTDFLRLDLPEVRGNVLHVQAEAVIDDIVTRYSTYQKLLRVAAWCLRFVLNIRKKQNRVLQSILLLQEVELAETRLKQLSQQRHYCKEIDVLKKNRQLPLKSCLIDKHPFIDGQGILRVGGRLINSQLDPMAKHPAIIHGKDPLTELIHEHAFLACLKRFVARRGCPGTLHTDNGLNFVGTKNLLEQSHRFLHSSVRD